MLISLTVGKVDAGVAVLLTEDKRLIEFPSILLPPSISSGSMVDITVSRNHASEAAAQDTFAQLQSTIYSTYGQSSPAAPVLRCRNATQTSVVLEWDPIELATADLRSLSLYRNGQKLGNIPRPREQTSTKLSGLAIDTEFTFSLVLRTSAGTYASERLTVRTHKMTDLSGITVTPGAMPQQIRDSLDVAVERIGVKITDTVRIDTTHFLCVEGRGREWERALEMNIPVVRPEWLEGCEREGRIVGVRGYYLDANPKLRQVGQGVGMGGGQSQPLPHRPQSQAEATPRQPQSGTPSAERPSDAETGPPPALPEKDVRPSLSVAQTPKGGIPSPQPSPNVESEEDEDESEEEGVSSGAARELEVKVESAQPSPVPGKDKEDDGGSFSEVAL